MRGLRAAVDDRAAEAGEVAGAGLVHAHRDPQARRPGGERRLEQAGDWPAAGLVVHVAYGGSNIEGVFEVWESRDAFERFGSKLMPLLDEVGIEVEPPEALDVYQMDSL